jgi:hypothetical protein
MSKADPMRARIEAFNRAHGGGVIVQHAARGYSLFSQYSGVPIARLRPTGEGDKVQVLWWSGQRWSASGPFGIATMPLDKARDCVAAEPDFWIHT